MSEESPLRRELGPKRSLSDTERALVTALLQKSGGEGGLISRLSCFHVHEMADGGMGSLYFADSPKQPHERKFGRRIAELQFNDVDGVAVIVSLNVDSEGNLFELDVWKTDFTPVIQLSEKRLP